MRPSNKRTSIVFLLGLLTLPACAFSPQGDGLPDQVTCVSCHGTAADASLGTEDDPAPPLAVRGGWDTSNPGVGAHRSHMRDGELRSAIDCEECHVVPTLLEATHVDGLPAELSWGPLATTEAQSPEYNQDSMSCKNVYCHGSTLAGGANTTPVWTVVDGTQAACGTCHGDPPPEPHPQAANCQVCHPATFTEDGLIDLEGGKHIDGVVDFVSPDSCSACHGNENNPAPPLSTDGESSTSAVTVGAHQSHLNESALGQAVACTECHIVPSSYMDPGHADASPAEVVFGPLAAANGSSPSWDRNEATCSNSYCHGATLTGGSLTSPSWTTVDGTQASCGTCHGAPPPAPHPGRQDCATCHPETVQLDGSINVAGGKHINGALEVADLDCSSCHGGEESPAPPVSTTGEVDTTAVTVGAHEAHLTDSYLRKAIACEECHVVPSEVTAAGHIDDAPAELVWGTLALTDGVSPLWDRDAATCSDTYCHGATILGGSKKTPVWTTVNGSQATCGTCHGVPPPSPHPAMSDCFMCHSQTMTSEGDINVEGEKHINGLVDVGGG